jgi:hypothetical protein
MNNFAKRSPFVTTVLVFAVFACLLAASSVMQHLASPIQTAQAQTSNLGSFSGYAWSDNLGWISFSGSNYQVVVQNDGTLSGYAWANPSDDSAPSNNIGWISFNKTVDFPSSCGSQATLSGTNITGWAKVLSADNNDWDGCVSLSGSSPAYGVIFNSSGSSQSGTLGGYAWADSAVGGWISFNCTTGGPTANDICAASNYAVTYTTNTPPPAVTAIILFTANPLRVRNGSATSLLYKITVADGVTCSGITSSDPSFTPYTNITADGLQHSVPTNPITKNTQYTLTCDTVSKTISVSPVPIYQEL